MDFSFPSADSDFGQVYFGNGNKESVDIVPEALSTINSKKKMQLNWTKIENTKNLYLLIWENSEICPFRYLSKMK